VEKTLAELEDVNSKSITIDMKTFALAEKDIHYAGNQLLNARRTFIAGFVLNLAGGILASSVALTTDPKTQLGLGIAGGVTSLVGSVVMITAVIPIGGAGKFLRGVQFPKTVTVNVN
jgi:hypothetical protein